MKDGQTPPPKINEEPSDGRPRGRELRGAAATRRFVELITCNAQTKMSWYVSPTTNLSRYLFVINDSFDRLARRLEKDQRASRNVGMDVHFFPHQHGTQRTSVACLEALDGEYYEDNDFPIPPDFVVWVSDNFWAAYWLLTSNENRSELEICLARHCEVKQSRYLHPVPVPGFLWHWQDMDPEEVVLIDNTGQSLGDISHYEGLHTFTEMMTSLQTEKELKRLTPDRHQPVLESTERTFGAVRIAHQRGKFLGFRDGEYKPPVAGHDLIENFLPDDSLYMVYGNTGSFKTFAMIDVACSAACGSQLWTDENTPDSRLRFDIPAPLRVTFIAGEGQDNIHKRIEAWKAYRNIRRKLDVFVIHGMPSFQGDDDLNRLIATISDDFGYTDILIIDPLIEAATGYNINDPSSARHFATQCKRLQRHLLCSICLIHHTGKDGKDHLGAQDLLAVVDVSDKIVARRTKSDRTQICITNKKFRDGPIRPPFLLEAVPTRVAVRASGKVIDSVMLSRLSHSPEAPDVRSSDDIAESARKILAERRGTGALKSKELAKEIAERHASGPLADGDRAPAVELVRRTLNSLATGKLRKYARRAGTGKTAAWLFECPSSEPAMAAE